jgi:hypothetical protein
MMQSDEKSIVLCIDDVVPDVAPLHPSLFRRIFKRNNLWSRYTPLMSSVVYLRLETKKIMRLDDGVDKTALLPASKWVVHALNSTVTRSEGETVNVKELSRDRSLRRAALAVLKIVDTQMYEETIKALARVHT